MLGEMRSNLTNPHIFQIGLFLLFFFGKVLGKWIIYDPSTVQPPTRLLSPSLPNPPAFMTRLEEALRLDLERGALGGRKPGEPGGRSRFPNEVKHEGVISMEIFHGFTWIFDTEQSPLLVKLWKIPVSWTSGKPGMMVKNSTIEAVFSLKYPVTGSRPWSWKLGVWSFRGQISRLIFLKEKNTCDSRKVKIRLQMFYYLAPFS